MHTLEYNIYVYINSIYWLTIKNVCSHTYIVRPNNDLN